MSRPTAAFSSFLLLSSLTVHAAPPPPAAPPAPPAAPAAGLAELVDASSYLQGGRQIDDQGNPIENDAWALLDGLPETQCEQKAGKVHPVIVELAERFDLTQALVVNSAVEKRFPGISVKELVLEQAPERTGPWTPLAKLALAQSKDPQRFPLDVKAVRYVRVTFAANHGHKEWFGIGELGLIGRRTAARPTDFTGAWKTRFGEMVLTQEGERITGCYSDKEKAGLNTVEGTHEGSIFIGTWREAAGSSTRVGLFVFALTADGDLSGVYSKSLTGRDRYNRWDGKRLAKTSIACVPPENALTEQLKDLKSQGRVVLRGILFDTGKDVIRAESIAVLKALAAAIQSDPKSRFVVEGHTDDRGGDGLNQPLSAKRASAVTKWLGENGVDPKRLEVKGFGASKPAMPNDTEAGRAANRRVEVAKVP